MRSQSLAFSLPLAEAAGTSKQPVSDLLARLVSEKLLVRRGRSYAWTHGPDGNLLERWVAGYVNTLRPHLLVGRFKLREEDPKAVERWVESVVPNAQFGGTAGAYRLAPHYRGPTTVVHLGEPSEATRKELRAVPAADGPLLWMRHIGSASAEGGASGTVHPLLIYAELRADSDPRAAEAAEQIRTRYLQWSI